MFTDAEGRRLLATEQSLILAQIDKGRGAAYFAIVAPDAAVRAECNAVSRRQQLNTGQIACLPSFGRSVQRTASFAVQGVAGRASRRMIAALARVACRKGQYRFSAPAFPEQESVKPSRDGAGIEATDGVNPS